MAVTEVPFLEALPGLVEPLGALWVNAIRMTVIPLVVGLIITGIASTGDPGTVGRIGGGALVLFLAFVASSAAFALLVGSPLLGLIPIDVAAAQNMTGSAAAGAGPVDLPPFRVNDEVSERRVITAPLPLAFPLHEEAVRRFFTDRNG